MTLNVRFVHLQEGDEDQYGEVRDEGSDDSEGEEADETSTLTANVSHVIIEQWFSTRGPTRGPQSKNVYRVKQPA